MADPTAEFHPDFSRWLNEAREGRISAEDLASLGRYLEQDPAARAYYVEYMSMCGALVFETFNDSGDRAVQTGQAFNPLTYQYTRDAAKTSEPCPLDLSKSKGRAKPTRPGSDDTVLQIGPLTIARRDRDGGRRIALKHVAWAAMLVIGGVLLALMLYNPSGSTTPQPPVAQQPVPAETYAVVNRSSGAGGRFSDGLELKAGNYSLDSGFVELQMQRGATVLLEGPCEFAVVDGNQLSLTAGALTADVPQRARLFTVQTPTMRLVDLGTRFGARVDADGVSTAAVFQGEVEVYDRPTEEQVNQANRVLVTAGEQVAVSSDGELSKKTAVAADHGFIQSWDAVQQRVVVQGQARYFESPPADVTDKGLRDSEHIVVFRESIAVLKKPMPAWSRLEKGGVPETIEIAAGRRVVSYFIHFAPENNATLDATLIFPGRVLGVVSGAQELLDTNAIFGLDSVNYIGAGADPFLFQPLDRRSPDTLQITGKKNNTLKLRLQVLKGLDQARVLVEVPYTPFAN